MAKKTKKQKNRRPKGHKTRPDHQRLDQNDIDSSQPAYRNEAPPPTQPPDGCPEPDKEPDEESSNQTIFGFKYVCKDCKSIYVRCMADYAMKESRPPKHGSWLGSLKHIRAEAGCDMCSVFLAIRWSDSPDGQYHLHGFSAANLIYGQSMKLLRSRFDGYKQRNGPLPPESDFPHLLYRRFTDNMDAPQLSDNIMFAVVADVQKPIPISTAWDELEPLTFMMSSALLWSESIEQWIQPEVQGSSTSPIWSRFYQRQRKTPSRGLLPLTEKARNHIYVPHPKPHIISVDDNQLAHIEGANKADWPHGLRFQPCPAVRRLPFTGFYGRPLSSTSIDYGLIKDWLAECDYQCSYRLKSFDKFIQEPKRLRQIPFYLLDCLSRTVFQVPPKALYCFVALSYVWGNVDNSARPRVDQLPYKLEGPVSATIEDAIAVTQKLGHRYLWVDCFCVSSTGPTRHQQIANMDLIYKKAELTIVAAAGDNADYGLPGVSTRSRRTQPQVQVGNHHYVATTLNRAPPSSKRIYDERAWTYQEYMFSRRRLVFTTQQVYYECLGNCTPKFQQESLSCPRPRLFERRSFEPSHEDDHVDVDMRDPYLKRLPRSVCLKDKRLGIRTRKSFTLMAFEHHVQQFTKRKMSYETDSLAAVTSVLDLLMEQSGPPVHQVQGVPFSLGVSLHYHHYPPSYHFFGLKYGLLWTHGATISPIRRRAVFPSWSWAGWEGQVSWMPETTDEEFFWEFGDDETKFAYYRKPNLGLSKGARIDPANFCPAEDWRPSRLRRTPDPDVLHFTARTYHIPLHRQVAADSDFEPGIYLDDENPKKPDWVRLSDCRLHVSRLDEETFSADKTSLLGIPLAAHTSESRQWYYVLVIQQVSEMQTFTRTDNVYERCGVIKIYEAWPGFDDDPPHCLGWLV